MKEYLKHLRWLLYGSALLPLVYHVCFSIPALMVSLDPIVVQLIHVIAAAILFVLSGRVLSRAGYSVAQSSFAGPTLLAVGHLFVGGLLKCLTYGPHLSFAKSAAERPAWLMWLSLPMSVLLSFLVLFPIALGLAALGAHQHRKGSI